MSQPPPLSLSLTIIIMIKIIIIILLNIPQPRCCVTLSFECSVAFLTRPDPPIGLFCGVRKNELDPIVVKGRGSDREMERERERERDTGRER